MRAPCETRARGARARSALRRRRPAPADRTRARGSALPSSTRGYTGAVATPMITRRARSRSAPKRGRQVGVRDHLARVEIAIGERHRRERVNRRRDELEQSRRARPSLRDGATAPSDVAERLRAAAAARARGAARRARTSARRRVPSATIVAAARNAASRVTGGDGVAHERGSRVDGSDERFAPTRADRVLRSRRSRVRRARRARDDSAQAASRSRSPRRPPVGSSR